MNKLIITNASAALESIQSEDSGISLKITDCFGSATIELSHKSALQLKEHLEDCTCVNGDNK